MAVGISAFVLVETEAGKYKDLASKIGEIKGVEFVCGVTGPYDIIAYIKARDIETMGDLVAQKIQPLPGVRKTITCLCTVCCPDYP